jgi:hypothetical protein
MEVGWYMRPSIVNRPGAAKKSQLREQWELQI